MIRQLINDLKSIGRKKNPESTMSVINNSIANGEPVNIRGNIYHIGDVNLYDIGYSVAAVFRCGFLNPVCVIATDENYNKLTDTTKEFVVLHEEGHIVNNHYCFFGGRNEDHERVADKYAVDKIGKEASIKALTELKKFTGIMGSIEVSKRIDSIKKM